MQGFGLGVMEARARWCAQEDGIDFSNGRVYGPHGGGFVAALGADFHFGAVFEPQCQERKNAHGTGLPGRGAQGDPGGRKPPD